MQLSRNFVVLFTSISITLTAYTLLVFIHPLSYSVFQASSNRTLLNGREELLSVGSPGTIPLFSSIICWLLTGYELFAERRKKITRILKNSPAVKGDHWKVYRIFKGTGGTRRLTIMGALTVPRKRNEIARITETDWKEVDRNIRILESANLVRERPVKRTYPLYELTEEGMKLLETIAPAIQS